MIERLELRRWRAFDAIRLDLSPGTTFLVAPNGVGKTSLLLGMTWAVFGEHSKVDAKDCVRLGRDDAEAFVTIGLRDSTKLVIHRTVTVGGKSTASFSDGDGSAVDTQRAQSLLNDEFGAPLEVAARLAVIRGSGREDGELDLREHLYDAFGVANLRSAAGAATQLHKEAVAARKKIRSATRAQLVNRDQLVAAAAQLERDLADLNDQREELVQKLRSAEQAQRSLRAWSAHEAALSARASEVGDLLRQTAVDGQTAETLEELTALATSSAEAAKALGAQAQADLTSARAQQLAATSALSLLEDHDPECPTCARPFHGDELQRALAAQQKSAADAQTRIGAANQLIEKAGASLTSNRELLAEVQRLSAPLATPETPMPASDPDAALAVAEAALREHDESSGSASRERTALLEQLSADDDVRSASVAEQAAYRREALAQATAAALSDTAERVANEYIEPLSQQVRWRWKALFGEDGLQLRPNGTIVRVVGDRELAWQQLSSGEQIWARLVASLLILQSSTTVPFAWFDEPLEHLDPRARRIVAADLATSTRNGQPPQLIVTTYEHTIARQLAEDVPEASILYLDRVDIEAIPPRRTPPDLNDNEFGESA